MLSVVENAAGREGNRGVSLCPQRIDLLVWKTVYDKWPQDGQWAEACQAAYVCRSS